MQERRLVLLAVVLAWAAAFLSLLSPMAGSAAAQKAEEPPKPDVSFVGIAKPNLVLRAQECIPIPKGPTNSRSSTAPTTAVEVMPAPQPGCVSGQDEATRATVTVLLQNAGPSLGPISFELLLDGGPPVLPEDGRTAVATAYSTTPVVLTFLLPESAHPMQAVLLGSGPADVAAKPLVTELTIKRTLSNRVFWLPFALGSVLGAFTLLVGFLTSGKLAKDAKGPWGWLKTSVLTGAAWKFTDNWATNITAVGALLAGVVAASNFFTDVVPGISPARFIGLSLLFGGMSVGAPLVYAAFGTQHCSKDDKDPNKKINFAVGTRGGLYAAGAVTLVAVYGELVTLGILTYYSVGTHAERGSFYALLSLAGLVMAIYTVRSFHNLVRLNDPDACDPPKIGTTANAILTAPLQGLRHSGVL